MKLLLDTNFLIDCIRFRIDFFHALSELEDLEGLIEVYVPLFCIKETEKLVKSKKVGEARLVLEMLKDPRIKILGAEKIGSVDTCLLGYAREGYSVATNDKKLLNRLRKEKIRSIRIRDRRVFDIAI